MEIDTTGMIELVNVMKGELGDRDCILLILTRIGNAVCFRHESKTRQSSILENCMIEELIDALVLAIRAWHGYAFLFDDQTEKLDNFEWFISKITGKISNALRPNHDWFQNDVQQLIVLLWQLLIFLGVNIEEEIKEQEDDEEDGDS